MHAEMSDVTPSPTDGSPQQRLSRLELCTCGAPILTEQASLLLSFSLLGRPQPAIINVRAFEAMAYRPRRTYWSVCSVVQISSFVKITRFFSFVYKVEENEEASQ